MQMQHGNDFFSKNKENAANRNGRRWFRNRFLVFFICLLISFSLWYLASYSKKETAYLSFPIQISNFPSGYILTAQSDKEIHFQLQASHNNIEKIKKKGRIPIDLSDLNPRKINNRYQAVVFVEPLLQRFFRQSDYTEHYDYVIPDSIAFFFETSVKKEIPIIADIQYTVADQHKQYTPLSISPETILVEGKKEYIDTLQSIRTRSINLGAIRDTFNQMVALEKLQSLQLHQDSVRICIPVTEFTEKQIEVAIAADTSNSSFYVKLLPDRVTVSCLVPVNKYNDVDASMFTIEAHYNREVAKYEKKLPVRIVVAPENVYVTRIAPEYVDYIIINQPKSGKNQ